MTAQGEERPRDSDHNTAACASLLPVCRNREPSPPDDKPPVTPTALFSAIARRSVRSRHMRTSIALDIDSYLKLEGGRNFVARTVRTTSEPDEAA